MPDYSSEVEYWEAIDKDWHFTYKGGGYLPIHDRASGSRDAKILDIRGYFYGKVKHAMPMSDRWSLKRDEIWNITSRIREVISTAYGSSTLVEREFWRFIVSGVYERVDEIWARMEWDREARDNFDLDIKALTLQGSMTARLYTLAAKALL